jgi:hypothetical protein
MLRYELHLQQGTAPRCWLAECGTHNFVHGRWQQVLQPHVSDVYQYGTWADPRGAIGRGRAGGG